jgi:hypothetical protein
MPPHIRPQSTVDAGLLLSDAGVLDWQNALICGVAVKTVRRWRRLFQRRGIERGGTAPGPPCFICDGGPLDAGAYGYLLGLYLGDGHIVINKRGLYVLSIFQDNHYPGLIEQCRDLIAVVKPGARPHLSAKDGCTAIQAYSKHWTCSFPQHGPGLKSKRYIFSKRSEDILGLCTWALDLLDISWRRSNTWHISVARRDAVAALDEFVGPKY